MKRHAEAHGRYTSPDSKKPRFDYRNPSTLAPDAPDEDAILELDEIGKGGQQTKRNAVNLDGYETDSSNENFDVRAQAKAELARQEGRPRNGDTGLQGSSAAKGGSGWNARGQTSKSKDEEENDMFADMDEDGGGGGAGVDGDEDEELSREGKKSKKDVRFLDVGDIEGQVNTSKSGGHVSADFTLQNGGKGKGKLPREQDDEQESSSESGGDEERDQLDPDDDDAEELGAGAKKHHAPRLDAFNMKEEGEEGRFDESGNYVRKARDPDAVHDSWLEGLNKKDLKKAAEAQEKRDEDQRRRNAEDDMLLSSDLYSTLISRLDKGETVLEALARLGGSKTKKKQQPKWKRNRKGQANSTVNADAMDVDSKSAHHETTGGDPVEQKRREAVEAITGAADALFSRDMLDIYDQEREVLMRLYKRETGEDWLGLETSTNNDEDGALDAATAAAGQGKTWEYRWSDARDGGERHGPYDGPTMQAWEQAGYFGEGVEFRRLHEEAWSRSVDFV